MTLMKSAGLSASVALLVALGGHAGTALAQDEEAGVSASAVVTHYADIALAAYQDSLIAALDLDDAIEKFLNETTEENLEAAREAWIIARVPYQQTEVYRFGNPIVDDWEGKVNAWPLDEGLIDYVDPGYGSESDSNPLYSANVVANPNLVINGEEVTIDLITPEVLSDVLHEADQVEANVATGYHAIEFLLWGQDLNGTEPGAGERPATDYSLTECTNENCDRRRDYLKAASELLVSDLREMVDAWAADGDARLAVTGGDPKTGLTAMLTGMGSLSYGELAGERMKLGLLLHDPEEEHDCFSDNTHASHYFDAVGIQNIYLGRYIRMDGTTLEGPALADYVAETDAALDREMRTKLGVTMARMRIMAAKGAAGETYDQLIAEGNETGNQVVQAVIDGLVDQTRSIERVVTALDLGDVSIEGSDSLDSPNAVFQ